MSSFSNRKVPRFFIINPVQDRRMEVRFESEEQVEVFLEGSKETISAVAYDIGKQGLRLRTKKPFDLDSSLQIGFHDNPENIRCFGHVVWSKSSEEGNAFECGVQITSWHGIVSGNNSWKKYKG